MSKPLLRHWVLGSRRLPALDLPLAQASALQFHLGQGVCDAVAYLNYLSRFYRLDGLVGVMQAEWAVAQKAGPNPPRILLHRQTGADIAHAEYRQTCYELPQVAKWLTVLALYEGRRWMSVHRYRSTEHGPFDDVTLAVLSLSLTQPFVGPLYHWRTSRPHEYGASPLNSVCDDNPLLTAGPGHGAPPRNVCLGPDDYLFDHLDHRFTLLFATASTIAADLLAVVADMRAQGLPLQVIAVGASQPVSGADQTLPDASGHLRERHGLQDGGAYLLRPDQHV